MPQPVTIDLATFVAFLALALAAPLYVRLLGQLPEGQRRAGRVDDITDTESSHANHDHHRNPTPARDASSQEHRSHVPGALESSLDARNVEVSEAVSDGSVLAGPSGANRPSPAEGLSTPRARPSKPVTLPATPPPTVPTRKEVRTSAPDVAVAGRSSGVKRSSTPSGSAIPRRQFMAAFPPSVPGSPPPRQRVMAALPTHHHPVSSASTVKMDVDPPVDPPAQGKGKGRARADSPVPAKVSFSTPRAPISAMSTITSIPAVSSRSTTPGSALTQLASNDNAMEVDRFYERVIKNRNLPLKPGQEKPDVVTTTWFRSEGQGLIDQPPPDECLETPTVGDVFRHRPDGYTPPIFQLFLRVQLDDGEPGWLSVDQGHRREQDGMRLIVTLTTEEASWVGDGQYRAVMRKSGYVQSPLRHSSPASDMSTLSSLSDA